MWAFIISSCLLGLGVLILLRAIIRKLKWFLSPRRRRWKKRQKKYQEKIDRLPYPDLSWSYYVRHLKSKPQFLFFDTETSGLPKDFNAKAAANDNWPRLVQLAWIVTDLDLNVLKAESHLVKPDGFEISKDAEKVNGISTEYALENGEDIIGVLRAFRNDVRSCCACIGHNIRFDQMVVGSEILRAGMKDVISGMTGIDTMESSKNYCCFRKPDGTVKRPKLQELYTFLFGEEFQYAHDAMADVTATMKCFEELIRLDVIRIAGYKKIKSHEN